VMELAWRLAVGAARKVLRLSTPRDRVVNGL